MSPPRCAVYCTPALNLQFGACGSLLLLMFTGTPAEKYSIPPKAAGSRPAGTKAPLAAAPSTAQMPSAPVDAMPPSAEKAVVPCRPATPCKPGTRTALMTPFTGFTKALTPGTTTDVAPQERQEARQGGKK